MIMYEMQAAVVDLNTSLSFIYSFLTFMWLLRFKRRPLVLLLNSTVSDLAKGTTMNFGPYSSGMSFFRVCGDAY